MKKTDIQEVAVSVMDLACDIGIAVTLLDDAETVALTRCAMLLLRAQEALNLARACLPNSVTTKRRFLKLDN